MIYCCEKCDFISNYKWHVVRHMCRKQKNLKYKCSYTECNYSTDIKAI